MAYLYQATPEDFFEWVPPAIFEITKICTVKNALKEENYFLGNFGFNPRKINESLFAVHQHILLLFVTLLKTFYLNIHKIKHIIKARNRYEFYTRCVSSNWINVVLNAVAHPMSIKLSTFKFVLLNYFAPCLFKHTVWGTLSFVVWCTLVLCFM